MYSTKVYTYLFAMSLFAGFSRAQTPVAPTLSMGIPMSGKLGSNFVIAVSLVNSGTVRADNVRLTSVTLGIVPAEQAGMRFARGPLDPAEPDVLVLKFNASSLIVGANYPLAIRGAYEVGGKQLEFSLNRIFADVMPSDSVASDLRRFITVDAINTKLDSLSPDDPATPETMLAFVQSNPAFVDAGISEAPKGVWAIFADGQPFVISFDRREPPQGSEPAMLPQETEQIGTSNAEQAETESATQSASAPRDKAWVSTWFAINQTTHPENAVRTALTAQNYEVSRAAPTVDELKGIGGEKVIYISTHGASLRVRPADKTNQNTMFGLLTSTVWTPEAVAGYMGSHEMDLPNPNLVLGSIDFGTAGHPNRKGYFAVTSHFIDRYWKPLAPGAFVYFDACSSDSLAAAAMKASVLAKGAQVYAGWTEDVDSNFSDRTARFVFDRLLGGKDPEFLEQDGFWQRPFEYASVKADMALHQYVVDTSPPHAHFAFTGNLAVPLTPSIDRVFVEEPTDKLHIYGVFPKDPGPALRSVTVDGVQFTQCTWGNIEIVCESLAQTGVGAVGDVVAEVLQHRSNPARLTEWHGSFHFVLNVGGLTQGSFYSTHFRADIRKHRSKIHLPPEEPIALMPPMKDSKLNYHSRGTASQSGATYSWSGSGTLPPVNFLRPTGNVFLFSLALSSSTQGKVKMGASAAQAVNYKVASPDGVVAGSGPLSFPPSAYALALNDAVIRANTVTVGNPGVFVPAPIMPLPTSTLHWDTIVPAFAPDPKSPR